MEKYICISLWPDRRVGYCFLQTIGGRCTARTSELRTVTKADCCCTMGAAWGPHCEICPSRDSDNYNELCLDKGFSVDGQGAVISFFSRQLEFCYHTIVLSVILSTVTIMVFCSLSICIFRYRRVQDHTRSLQEWPVHQYPRFLQVHLQ